MSWLTLRAQAAIAAGDIAFPEKITSTSNCSYYFVPKPPVMNLIGNNTDAHAE